MLALFLVCPGGEVSWWGFWFFMDKSSGAGVHAGCYAAPLSLVGVLVLLGGSASGGGCDLWFWRSYLFSYALYGACFFSLSAAALRLGGAAYVLLFSPSGAAALPAVVVGAGLVCVGDAGVVCSSRYAGDSFLAVSDGATRLFGVSHTLVILTVFCALALTFSVSHAAGSDTWRFVCDRTTHVLPALG